MALPSISTWFQTAPSGPAPAAPVTPTATAPVASSAPANVDNPTAPAAPTDVVKSPLEPFANLWEPVKVDPNAPTPTSIFNTDLKTMMEAAGKTDFTGALSKEVLNRVAAGGEDAVAAMAEAFNKHGQTVYGQASYAATKIAERALQEGRDSLLAQIPDLIRKHTVTDTLRTENPIFSNPAVAPLVDAVKSQLAIKNPNATASELTVLAKDYLKTFGEQFAPAKAPKNSSGAKEKGNDTDWSKFLG